jgi:Flp pilus assembly pilin Flp
MNNFISALHHCVRSFMLRNEGQDLVEYSLVFAMIALGAVTGMGYLATGINSEFSNVAATLTSSTS